MTLIFRTTRLLGTAAFFGYLTSCTACLEQYDPKPVRKQLSDESSFANATHPVLADNGELPTAGAKVVSIDERYSTLCAGCHGTNGGGDGPSGAALNPKPRNLTDVAWQDTTDDARIYKVIKEGGASVGLSATMAPWGVVLSDDEIKNMVTKVRGFRGK